MTRQAALPSTRPLCSRRTSTRTATVIAIASLLLLGALALTGCASSGRSSVDVTVHPQGNVTVEARIPGTVSDLNRATLTSANWDVKQGGGNWIATRTMGATDLDAATNELTTAVSTSFWQTEGFFPAVTDQPSLTLEETDLLAAKIFKLSFVSPVADVAPTECLTCSGSGSQDCPSCVGGTINCEQCGGTGTLTCSTCSGSGEEECWWCEGSGTDSWGDECSWCAGEGSVTCSECEGAGEVECDYCGGVGQYECYDCDGAGSFTCETCGGSGEPNESDIVAYRASVDGAAVDLNLNMPGMVMYASSEGEPAWKLSGTDAVSGDEFSAVSVVFNWPVLAGAFGVLVLLVVAAIVLARRGKKAKASSESAESADAADADPSTGEAADATFAEGESVAEVSADAAPASKPAEPAKPVKPAKAPKASKSPAGGKKFCTQCGAPATTGAAFCTTCGAKIDK